MSTPDHLGLTILIVDDEPDVREILSLALETEGFVVLQAENGQEALQILKNVAHFPSVIVLDLSMPVLDGHGFLNQRAQDSILADIPVIVVSGGGGPDKPLPGVEVFLQKPIEMARLLKIIGHSIDQRKNPDRLSTQPQL